MSSKHCADMDINAEVSKQLSIIDALLSNLDKTIAPCSDKKNEQKEEEAQNEMPDSTTNTEKSSGNPFHVGDDVLLPNKDGKYYLGTIVELSTNNDNDSCEVGTGVARCLVKFGDGTHSWAAVSRLKLLSAPPADDGRIMCVVCKRREPAAGPTSNAIIACDMCGRGYHAKCHSPPVDAWINGASWHCKRCVDQRYKVAAAENRALKRSDMLRFKGSQQRRQQQELTPPCDTASFTASIHSDGANDQDPHCYCGEKKDYLAQMLQCCRCSRWFHQRCVSSLRYPLYAGDKLYIFACGTCNCGAEYLRRLELCWLELAHLALYNLTAYNAPNYFDLDTVIMPYIQDNWHALQLPVKMWRTPVNERRERILTALTSSRKRFKCGREMKKRATIWGLRLRRPPPPPAQLAQLEQVKTGEPLTDEVVRMYAPRLRFLPRTPFPPVSSEDDSMQPSSSNTDKSSYKTHDQSMIVPVDGHWLNLMMGKRFHENLSSNSNSENDSNSTCSSESSKPTEAEEQPSPSASQPTVTCIARESDTKADIEKNEVIETTNEATPTYEIPPVPSLVQCTVKLDKISKDDVATSTATCKSEADTSLSKSDVNTININTHSSRIATMNLEVSKLSTKNIIEHSKIMSLQHMDRQPVLNGHFLELDSSGDEASRRGTLDTFIPPLKDFHGTNNPFLMQFKYPSKKALASSKQNGRQNQLNGRLSLPLPMQYNSGMASLGRPIKRKLSEKDIVIGPNGEVKRRKFRRPRKYLQLQLNKSCPLPDDSNNTVTTPPENDMPAPQSVHVKNVKFHGRRLRQRQEKNYSENSRRNNVNNSANCSNSINSVRSLQLSPHKSSSTSAEVEAEQLSVLKTSVQSYFRAGQTFRVLARRKVPRAQPAYLIEWDTAS